LVAAGASATGALKAIGPPNATLSVDAPFADGEPVAEEPPKSIVKPPNGSFGADSSGSGVEPAVGPERVGSSVIVLIVARKRYPQGVSAGVV